MQRPYGPRFRVLHWCTDQMLTEALSKMDLTASQGRIMAYLVRHPDRPPCPRDLEEFFHLSHPSVSGTLSRMEKKGFIETRTDEADRRVKRIHILPRGMECYEQMDKKIRGIEEQIIRGMSEEEQVQFSALLDRAIQNMGGYPFKPFQKEESAK